MAISTIQEVIDRSQVSIYLSGNDNATGALMGPRKAAPGSPISIALISDALNWGYDGGAQTDEDVRQMANYLEWLIGKYGQEAQAILQGAGGGTIIPGGGATRPAQLNFTVAASGTTLVDGQSSVTLPSTWAGFNVLVNKNGQPLTQISTAPIFYTWDSTTRVLTFNQDALTGDEFQITPA